MLRRLLACWYVALLLSRAALALPTVELKAVGSFDDPHEITVAPGTTVRLAYTISMVADLNAFQNDLTVTGDYTGLSVTADGTWWGAQPDTALSLTYLSVTEYWRLMGVVNIPPLDPPFAFSSTTKASLAFIDITPQGGDVVIDLLSLAGNGTGFDPEHVWWGADPDDMDPMWAIDVDLANSLPQVVIHTATDGPGALRIEERPLVGGSLNPNGPAPHSLGIITIELNGNPTDTVFAIKIGSDPNAGWLRPGNPALDPTEDARDVYPRATAAEAAWLTRAEWEGKRLRGLDADTLYTFRARAQSGGGDPTVSVVVGVYSTSKEGDVNGSGRATALDYAYIKAAILRSAAIEDAWPCNTRHTDREINGLDLSKTWSEALGP